MAQSEKGHARTTSTDHRASWSWRKLFGRDSHHHNHQVPSPAPLEKDVEVDRPGINNRFGRRVVPRLPRAGTFKRQQSELRDKLEPVKPAPGERRTLSVDRRRHVSGRSSSIALANGRLSAPLLLEPTTSIDGVVESAGTTTSTAGDAAEPGITANTHGGDTQDQEYASLSKETSKDTSNLDTASYSTEAFDEMILEELERVWILNLSMHFRDKSKREKFFVTYAETPTHWRRVTISLDYRNAPKGSLEEVLLQTRYQRDKSVRIYEAIRESLQDIQFYNTVTNLKLQTENDRLHVHVVEDLAEIISYPSVGAISYLECRRVYEGDLVFDSHLSGFVYKVTLNGEVFIKKEIPGPDTVDEFLYEINALHRLSGSRSVIKFGGVVLDNKREVVKGLLISYAEKGALIDVIYDGNHGIPWYRRERWAKQIVRGLSEIHEAGFVQGDFTLSNIVVDGHDDAKIIDINRRGCPVGWEPPELAALIKTNQKISMYIGVKSDLYQLGMVLYALAIQDDEPETKRPFNLDYFPKGIPDYYIDICRRCLDDDPRRRPQAETLLELFPPVDETPCETVDEKTPIPIIVDARHVDDIFSNGDGYSAKAYSDYRKPSYQYSPSSVPGGGYGYAPTDATDDSDYVRGRGRGRSPPSSGRRPLEPHEIPLPASYTESECLDTTRDTTPTQHRATETAPGSAQKDQPGAAGAQDIDERREQQHPADEETVGRADSTAEKARATQTPTAAARALPNMLVGVGSAHSADLADLEIPAAASLDDDDDLTT
jgi:serine/threonine protein kinase